MVVDDNRNVLSALRIVLESRFEEVTLLGAPTNLIATLREKHPDIVLLDMNFSAGINSGNEGLFWLGEIKKVAPQMPVVLFTAYADVDLAVDALRRGAADFVVKPWDNAKLIAALQMNMRGSKTEQKEEICWGVSRRMQELLKVLTKVAATDVDVLVVGENGVGKELIARELHAKSKRQDKPLVSVDLGAVTETLFESELFGHVKGAFTDAKADRAGQFEAANKGTLFLDEIGNLSLSLQAKLLTALQSRKITRVGSNKAIDIDIRLISATNRNLHEGFREDLLYRINTITLEVPPLRDRREDIRPLAEFFLAKYAVKHDRRGMTLGEKAVEKLENYRWPGNVRELQHAIERAVILADGEQLTAADFYFPSTETTAAPTLEAMERALIDKTLLQHGGNMSAAAAQLGISRPTLYSKMKKFK